MLKLHERHNITLDANMLVAEACKDFDSHGQTCAVYTTLMLGLFDSSDDIDQIPCILQLDVKQTKAVNATIKKIQNAQHWKKLTFGEKLSVIAENIGGAAKYLIREERHGNTSTPGGLAE